MHTWLALASVAAALTVPPGPPLSPSRLGRLAQVSVKLAGRELNRQWETVTLAVPRKRARSSFVSRVAAAVHDDLDAVQKGAVGLIFYAGHTAGAVAELPADCALCGGVFQRRWCGDGDVGPPRLSLPELPPGAREPWRAQVKAASAARRELSLSARATAAAVKRKLRETASSPALSRRLLAKLRDIAADDGASPSPAPPPRRLPRLHFAPPEWVRELRRGVESKLEWRTVDYATLMHSTLLLSMATYNLRLLSADDEAEAAADAADPRLLSADDADTATDPADDTTDDDTAPPPLPPPGRAAAAAAYARGVYTRGVARRRTSTDNQRSARAAEAARLDAAATACNDRLARLALGGAPFVLHKVRGAKACALVALSEDLGVAVIAFRGTKDLSDILTDINVLPTAVRVRGAAGAAHTALTARSVPPGKSRGGLRLRLRRLQRRRRRRRGLVGRSSVARCHRGFVTAFDSIAPGLDAVLPKQCRLLLTGHSLGGSLAQLAALRYAARRPSLVTYAAPAIGDAAFAKALEAAAEPAGGLRVYNTGDPVPLLPNPFSWVHAGVAVERSLPEESLEAFEEISQADLPGRRRVAPHVVYNVGATTYALWSQKWA